MQNPKYLYPDKDKLNLEFRKNYGEEFLKLNGLKIGDIVEISFKYQTCYRGYKNEQFTSSWERIEKGILKYDENMCLYAESIEKMPFYDYESNGKRGKSEKRIPVYRPRKSIVKFGTGFIN